MELKLFIPGEPTVLFRELPGLTVVTEWHRNRCLGCLVRLGPPRSARTYRRCSMHFVGGFWRPSSGQRGGLRHYAVRRPGVYAADSVHDSITCLRTFFELRRDGTVEILYQTRLPGLREDCERALARARTYWSTGEGVEESESLKA